MVVTVVVIEIFVVKAVGNADKLGDWILVTTMLLLKKVAFSPTGSCFISKLRFL